MTSPSPGYVPDICRGFEVADRCITTLDIVTGVFICVIFACMIAWPLTRSWRRPIAYSLIAVFLMAIINAPDDYAFVMFIIALVVLLAVIAVGSAIVVGSYLYGLYKAEDRLAYLGAPEEGEWP